MRWHKLKFSKNIIKEKLKLEQLSEILKHPLSISIIVLIIIVSGIFGIFQLIPSNEQKGNLEIKERYWGNPDAKVIIEYYSDLECPACKEFWFNVEKPLREKYSQEVKFIYKHFPLTSIHPRAADAAAAAEAAGEQGKFFEFIDILYEKQNPTEVRSWNTDKFVEYAKEIGIPDIDKFKNDLKSKEYKQVIYQYKKLGEEKGINATPTVYINGEKMDILNYNHIEKKINILLNTNADDS